jgi:hypothetical protein
MDSLGGILTYGLLGNPIIGQFNLFFGIIDVEVEEVRGGTGSAFTKEEEEKQYFINVMVRLFGKQVKNKFKVNEKFAKVTVKSLYRFKTLQSKRTVKVKIAEEQNIIKIKLKE